MILKLAMITDLNNGNELVLQESALGTTNIYDTANKFLASYHESFFSVLEEYLIKRNYKLQQIDDYKVEI